jgi:hypothetical protein
MGGRASWGVQRAGGQAQRYAGLPARAEGALRRTPKGRSAAARRAARTKILSLRPLKTTAVLALLESQHAAACACPADGPGAKPISAGPADHA